MQYWEYENYMLCYLLMNAACFGIFCKAIVKQHQTA